MPQFGIDKDVIPLFKGCVDSDDLDKIRNFAKLTAQVNGIALQNFCEGVCLVVLAVSSGSRRTDKPPHLSFVLLGVK